jgi:hypothetical protein
MNASAKASICNAVLEEQGIDFSCLYSRGICRSIENLHLKG